MTLSEHDIRPADLDALRYAAQLEDIAWLAARRDAFVCTSCPACAGTTAKPCYEKHGFAWHRCSGCGTVHMQPRPSPAILAEFYARSALYEVWNRHIFPRSREVRRERIFRPRVERLLSLCEGLGLSGGTLLEIGAAHGIFCDEMRRTGRFDRVIAVEPSAAQAETCRSLGVETIESAVEAITGLDGCIDVVAAFEVVEHLSDPAGMIAAAGRMLRPGGLLIVSTPHVDGFEIATLGVESDQVYPEHVTLFSLAGARRLVERAGLDMLELITPGQLDCDIVRNKAKAGRIDLSGQPFLARVLLEEPERLAPLFQAFLAANQLSSHLWFAARRPEAKP